MVLPVFNLCSVLNRAIFAGVARLLLWLLKKKKKNSIYLLESVKSPFVCTQLMC